jgi:hypothetical protein
MRSRHPLKFKSMEIFNRMAQKSRAQNQERRNARMATMPMN